MQITVALAHPAAALARLHQRRESLELQLAPLLQNRRTLCDFRSVAILHQVVQSFHQRSHILFGRTQSRARWRTTGSAVKSNQRLRQIGQMLTAQFAPLAEMVE